MTTPPSNLAGCLYAADHFDVGVRAVRKPECGEERVSLIEVDFDIFESVIIITIDNESGLQKQKWDWLEFV